MAKIPTFGRQKSSCALFVVAKPLFAPHICLSNQTKINMYLIPIVIVLVFLSLVTVQQGTVAMTTIFGKYNRTLRPGLNFRIPIIEVVFNYPLVGPR